MSITSFWETEPESIQFERLRQGVPTNAMPTVATVLLVGNHS